MAAPRWTSNINSEGWPRASQAMAVAMALEAAAVLAVGRGRRERGACRADRFRAGDGVRVVGAMRRWDRTCGRPRERWHWPRRPGGNDGGGGGGGGGACPCAGGGDGGRVAESARPPGLVELNQDLARFNTRGRTEPKLGQTENRIIRPSFGRTWPKVGRIQPNVGRTRPTQTRCGRPSLWSNAA